MSAFAMPYHRAHQMADGRYAVVHAIAGTQHAPLSQQVVAVDVEGFSDWISATRVAESMNHDRRRDAVQAANAAGLRGVRL
jgi:heme/copper-type cytochrome/quinol oxidase subunit 2